MIAEHTCQKYSGRACRSAAAKDLEAGAIELAVRAHVRNAHTGYDELLAHGISPGKPRFLVPEAVVKRLEQWEHGETRRRGRNDDSIK